MDYINAHGTSTPMNDVCETQAVKPPLGTRPQADDEFHQVHDRPYAGAAGAVEAIFTALSLKGGLLSPPPSAIGNPIRSADLDIVPNEGRKARPAMLMSNSPGLRRPQRQYSAEEMGRHEEMELNANQIQGSAPIVRPSCWWTGSPTTSPALGQRQKGGYRQRPLFADFPQHHVMPGVLSMEALAWGAVAILSLPENRGKIAFFGGIKMHASNAGWSPATCWSSPVSWGSGGEAGVR